MYRELLESLNKKIFEIQPENLEAAGDKLEFALVCWRLEMSGISIRLAAILKEYEERIKELESGK